MRTARIAVHAGAFLSLTVLAVVTMPLSYAGKGYAERTQMMQQLQRRRITGEGKRAPFDFVPGDGLVQECHIHTDSVCVRQRKQEREVEAPSHCNF